MQNVRGQRTCASASKLAVITALLLLEGKINTELMGLRSCPRSRGEESRGHTDMHPTAQQRDAEATSPGHNSPKEWEILGKTIGGVTQSWLPCAVPALGTAFFQIWGLPGTNLQSFHLSTGFWLTSCLFSAAFLLFYSKLLQNRMCLRVSFMQRTKMLLNSKHSLTCLAYKRKIKA